MSPSDQLMSCLAAALILLAGADLPAQEAEGWQAAPGHPQLLLWPGKVPDARPVVRPEKATTITDKGEPWVAVTDVSQPTMTVYAPAGTNTGAAVLVCPGGGYKVLAIDGEGTAVCDWLTARGITCVVLKYRVPDSGPHWDERCQCQRYPSAPTALEDAQRALRLVRFHAGEWHIDPHKVGVMGFSAGGHLVAATSNRFAEHLYAPADEADLESCRPDFAVALYPGHLSIDPHPDRLNPEIRVTKQTPPTLIVQAEDDPVDDVQNSLVYFAALKKAGVPAELHVYAQGGHAFGVKRTKLPITGWPRLAEAWMETIGVLPAAPPIEAPGSRRQPPSE